MQWRINRATLPDSAIRPRRGGLASGHQTQKHDGGGRVAAKMKEVKTAHAEKSLDQKMLHDLRHLGQERCNMQPLHAPLNKQNRFPDDQSRKKATYLV